jgi:hypothetical protein
MRNDEYEDNEAMMMVIILATWRKDFREEARNGPGKGAPD